MPRPRPDVPKPKGPRGDAAGTIKSLKAAQEFLKRHGYVLTAYGPYRISFYRRDTVRTPEGLVPEQDWYHMTQQRFAVFTANLSSGRLAP